MLLKDLTGEQALAAAEFETEIAGLSADSRTVEQGFLFAALKGSSVDGSAYVEAARAAGACALLVGSDTPYAALRTPHAEACPIIVSDDPRRELALFAARFHAAQPETLVAVTGTSGKTSVAVFLRQIFAFAGFEAASLGTIGTVTSRGANYGGLTTPDPVTLHEVLSRLAHDGITHAALEASSHGLDQRRLDGLSLSAAAFTNLGRDHLDYHADVEDYLAAKLRLFETLLDADKPVVVEPSAPYAERVILAARAAGHPVYTVGEGGEDIALVEIRHEGFTQILTLETERGMREVRLPLAGRFQVSNALIAAGLAVCVGVDLDAALEALEHLEGAPGRLERIGETDDGALVFVDYAHKPDALDTALAALRPFTRGRLIVVFGAGGDRDKGKRPLMGEAAARQADIVIVTDDNPRSEDPTEIRAEIMAAAPGALEIGDRHAAIEAAVGMLQDGDVLCIAGKGHETGQIVGGTVYPFSDHEVARAAIDAAAEAALFEAFREEGSEDGDLDFELDLASDETVAGADEADTGRDEPASAEAGALPEISLDFEDLLQGLVGDETPARTEPEADADGLPELPASADGETVTEDEGTFLATADPEPEALESEAGVDYSADEIAAEEALFAEIMGHGSQTSVGAYADEETSMPAGDETASFDRELGDADLADEDDGVAEDSAAVAGAQEDDFLFDGEVEHEAVADEDASSEPVVAAPADADEEIERREPDLLEPEFVEPEDDVRDDHAGFEQSVAAAGEAEAHTPEIVLAETPDETDDGNEDAVAQDEVAALHEAEKPEPVSSSARMIAAAAAATGGAFAMATRTGTEPHPEAFGDWAHVDPDRPLWTLAEMIEATDGEAIGCDVGEITGISIDSRSVAPGDAFVAIAGERFDGHDFADAALEAGAALAIVSWARHSSLTAGGRYLVVDDPLEALRDLARASRARSTARIVAVTGSVGKTSTKDMLKLALDRSGPTHAPVASFNNHWGVPLTLARMPAQSHFGIFEIGMNHAGEITPLVELVRPHAVIITTVGPVHLEFFGSVERIAQAKAEIFSGLEPGGLAILNRDNDQFDLLSYHAKIAGVRRMATFGREGPADAQAEHISAQTGCTSISGHIFDQEITYKIGAPGSHLVTNSLAVLAAVAELGGDLALAGLALADFHAPKGRGAQSVLKLRSGTATLIDESYNANPSSMRAALRLLGETPTSASGRRIAVIGDMLELGAAELQLHAALRGPVADCRADLVYCVGRRSHALWEVLPKHVRGAYSEEAASLRPLLLEELRPGDVIMIKGSLGTRMGPLVDALRREFPVDDDGAE